MDLMHIQQNGYEAKGIPGKLRSVCCIGAGYVGGPSCSVIAFKCPHLKVVVVDKEVSRIDAWNSNELPCYEPGLAEIVRKCRGRNLFFSTDVESAIEESELIFISVNTPTKKVGFGQGRAPDLQYIESCARMISKFSKGDKIIVEKSTVPVNAAKIITDILTATNNASSFNYVVLSNPEFLSEGTAVSDLLFPDRILIGGPDTYEGKLAIDYLSNMFQNWIPAEKIITMNTWSAELSKLVANSMLAQRISSINSISAICELTGAYIDDVSFAVGRDSRIGQKYLKASLGFGGSCLQKDVLCLVYLAESLNLQTVADYWLQVIRINDWQKKRFAEMIVSKMFNSVVGKKIAIFGFSFKKDTADTRNSAAIDVCIYMLEEGALLSIYDPKVPSSMILRDLYCRFSPDKVKELVTVHNDAYVTVDKAHAIVICTEWDEFKEFDYHKILERMSKPAFIFDGRLLTNAKKLEKIGFSVYGIGR